MKVGNSSAVIDTGAEISTIRRSEIPRELRQLINENERTNVRLADGSRVELKSSLKIPIVFEDRKGENFAAKLFLFEEGPKMLIGSDILTKGKINVNFQKRRLDSPRKKTRSVELANSACLRLNRDFLEERDGREINVHALDDAEIPGNSGAWVTFRCRGAGTYHLRRSLLEGGTIIVPDSLVSVGADGIGRLGLINLSENPQSITRNHMLGCICRVADKDLKQVSKRTVSQAVTLDVENKAQLCVVQCLARTEKCKRTRQVAHKEQGAQSSAESKITRDDITCGNKEAVEELTALLNHHRKTVRKRNEKINAANVGEYKITLEEGTTPSFKKQFPIREDLKDRVSELIDEMLDEDIIEPSLSMWNSPLFLIKKKNNKFRPVVDFRRINAKTKVEIFPIPVISEILANLHGAEWFSTVDLKSAYWQVPLSEETKEITAFTTFKGRFQFKRLPFGLVNAPSHFCKLMTGVLAELLRAGVMAYLDDVVVFSHSVSEHLKKLDTLLCRLGEFGLQVRLEKSKFLFNELECLGHMVSKKGVSADPKKLAAISEMKSPKDKKGLMRVLGTLNYYREFIPRFSSLALPLTELLGNNVKFEWKTRQEIAFRALTDHLVRAPILIFPE